MIRQGLFNILAGGGAIAPAAPMTFHCKGYSFKRVKACSLYKQRFAPAGNFPWNRLCDKDSVLVSQQRKELHVRRSEM